MYLLINDTLSARTEPANHDKTSWVTLFKLSGTFLLLGLESVSKAEGCVTVRDLCVTGWCAVMHCCSLGAGHQSLTQQSLSNQCLCMEQKTLELTGLQRGQHELLWSSSNFHQVVENITSQLLLYLHLLALVYSVLSFCINRAKTKECLLVYN